MMNYKDVVLIGHTGTGKSTTGNILLGLSPDGKTKKNPSDEIVKFQKDGLLCDEYEYFVTSSDPRSCTKQMSMLGNKRRNIRVTDVPGFGDSERNGLTTAMQTNLQFIREVARLNDVCRFDCVLYFLPFTGVSERADGNFREELEVLYHYFGESVFEHMILIARNSKKPGAQADGFTPNDKEKCKKLFEYTIKQATEQKYSKCPQLLYVPFDFKESHDLLQAAVQDFKVPSSPIQLVAVCIKCSCNVYHDTVVDRRDGKITMIAHSMCHPAFIPKHTKIKQFFGTLLHIITLGIPYAIAKQVNKTIWPGLGNNEEKCISCCNAPGTPGCLTINTRGKTKDGVHFPKVEHSNKTETIEAVPN